MPLNDCLKFVEDCGCGNLHLSGEQHEDFLALFPNYDNHTWRLVNYEHPDRQTFHLTFIKDELERVTLTYQKDYCHCDTIIYLLVNFEISSSLTDVILTDVKKYEECYPYYRYPEEFEALIQYLDNKPHIKPIILYFITVWRKFYPGTLGKFETYI